MTAEPAQRWIHSSRIVVVIGILLVAGIALTLWSLQSEEEVLRSDLLVKTRLASQGIDPADVAALSGTESDLALPEYRHLKEQMVRIREADPEIRFVYLLGRRADGTYFFFGDSESPDSPDYSFPGQEYGEATILIREIFRTGIEATGGPDTDRWGTWVSGVVPVRDPADGSMVAVFGIDVTARDWDRQIIRAGLPAAMVTLLMLILALTFLFIQDQEMREHKRLVASEQAARESEERYRLLFTQSPVGIIQLDSSGTIVTSNGRFAEIIGVRPDSLIGFNILTRAGNPEIVQALREALAGRTGYFEGGYTTSLTGRHLILRILAKPVGTQETTRPGIIAIVEDITERKAAESALFMSNRKLNLLSSITRHDILNQLVILKGFIRMAMKQETSPGQAEQFLSRAYGSADTIEKQILFTRDYQDLGVQSPAWQNVRACVETAAKDLPLRNVRIDITCPDLSIYADPLLGKVFYNLIDNALRYGGERLSVIRISAEETGADLTLVCENDGESISDADRPHLFEQGYGKNTGLGLFLVREILSITGITIRETSLPGSGARFELAIPPQGYRLPKPGS